MSLKAKAPKCAVCSAYLFEEDDVVCCPICGAPHHRECYNKIGHCGLEDAHGTENEYKKPAEDGAQLQKTEAEKPENEGSVCRRCGMPVEEDARFCPHCATPIGEEIPFGAMPYTIRFDFDKKAEIQKDVTAGDAARVVSVNPFRYIPKFLTLSEGKKTSWNWASFLLPHAWFAYRKMYKSAFISGAFMLMAELFTLPLAVAMTQIPETTEKFANYMQLGVYYAEHLGEAGAVPILLAVIGLLVNLATRIISGIFGDWIYKNRVVSTVRKINQSEDKETESRKLGGVSFIGFAVAIFGVTAIYDLISIFLI